VPHDSEVDNSDAVCVKTLLLSLTFASQTTREEAIPDAFQRTFDWIFGERPSQDPAGEDMWSPFPQWLKSGSSDVYWITGKPGSGKSTMMKYLIRDARTFSSLRQWSSPLPCLTAAFYSWNAGDELQKSQDGLLQSLLHQILRQAPDIAHKLLPGRWAMLKMFGEAAADQLPIWTRRELFDGLVSLGTFTNHIFNVAMFIDGLDEFTGDFTELIQLVKQLHSCPGVKVCVSSRPWNEFRDAFVDCPQLRMEKLTQDDMQTFVRGKFQSNRAFIELHHTSPVIADELLSGIVEKASGVFLWVSVIVKTALAGLVDGDKLADLKATLEALPNDLENLYDALWSGIKPEYKEDGARLFTVFSAFRDMNLSALYFSKFLGRLAIVGIPGQILWFADGGVLEDDRYISQTLIRRLASRTRGLLEASPSGQVDCLHRTVNDWLKVALPNLQRSNTPTFDADLAILEGVVMDFSQDMGGYTEGGVRQQLALHLFCLYLASRDRGITENRTRLSSALDKLASLLTATGLRTGWVNAFPHSPHTGFIAVAADFGITSYVGERAKSSLDHLLPVTANTGENLKLIHPISRLLLGPEPIVSGLLAGGAYSDLYGTIPNKLLELFAFNASERYKLADQLIGLASAKTEYRADVLQPLLAWLHRKVRLLVYGPKSRKGAIDFKTIMIPVNASGRKKLPYGIAVMKMLERHGFEGSFQARLSRLRKSWSG